MEVSGSSNQKKLGSGDQGGDNTTESQETEGPQQGFSLKRRLKRLLEQHGLTAARLARRSGVPKQVLSLWLAGTEPRKLSHIKRVAQCFGLTVDELCFGERVSPSRDDEWIEGVFEGRVRRVKALPTGGKR
jgi:hypothetical protein